MYRQAIKSSVRPFTRAFHSPFPANMGVQTAKASAAARTDVYDKHVEHTQTSSVNGRPINIISPSHTHSFHSVPLGAYPVATPFEQPNLSEAPEPSKTHA
ncbi:hypothetical protein CYLTODRAFT_449951 [Cylindrobasidium torrendii FP15055 ss-10]|uniref:Uncharacterized protein n=1 Tax=Cylindrobasidium torrendii FP15055 ss-10 TaxID=1314674 RepID=A0A0D7BQF7_9AGAR|nr:hypothetical protein CYLTODRAFT_449951 [Cylindrobasidium torrendii FP15055 ss-10]